MLRFEDICINTAGLLWYEIGRDTLTFYFISRPDPLVMKGPQAVRFAVELDHIWPDVLQQEREFRNAQAETKSPALRDFVVQRGPIPLVNPNQ